VTSRAALVALATALAVAAAPQPVRADGDACSDVVVERARPMMATIVTVTARGCPAGLLEDGIREAFAEMDRLAGLLSEWNPDGPVALVNRSAGRAPVPVPPEVLDVLTRAAAVSSRTAGGFDVTWAALAGVWRFDGARPPRLPARAEVRRRRALVAFRDLVVDRSAGTAFLRRPGMRVGLGGIAKGYIAEAGANLLVSRGIRNVLVAASGDIAARGRNGDRPWVVAIRDPRDPSAVLGTVELADESISTSGDYERYFVVDGRRYHHLLDPRTGYPATASESVTVVARHGAEADALATGLFVIGPDRARATLSGDPDVSAVLVGQDGRLHLAGAPRSFRALDTARASSGG
jgi:thiamine biosynthesis lipoprotein